MTAVFNLRRLIICEGPDDCHFLRLLINARNIPPFHVTDTALAKNATAGNTLFGRRLAAVSTSRHFSNLKDIVLITDCDDDPNASFQNIRDQIQSALGFAPAAAVTRTPNPSNAFHISVVMIPWIDIAGCLETLCVAAAKTANEKIAAATDLFAAQVRIETWRPNSQGKMWLRANLAARYERDPFIALGNVFSDPRSHDLIPLNHGSFNQLANYLLSIPVPPQPLDT